MKFIYTDIDYVLSLGSEIVNHHTKWGILQKFNPKAVNVYNHILKETSAIPVITSDWRFNHTLSKLQEIFIEWAKIDVPPIDVIPELPRRTVQNMDEWRAKEILMHVEKHKPEAWVAIDDMDLSKWLGDDHFVHLPKFMEGIKQIGKAEKIIKKLNNKI
jgi:hypothetical protein